jgi:hypothetical protein
MGKVRSDGKNKRRPPDRRRHRLTASSPKSTEPQTHVKGDNAMSLRAGKRTVNPKNGKPSYISIESDTNDFDDDSTVKVTDENGDEWNAVAKYKQNPKILPIRLKGKKLGLGHIVSDDIVPDAGQLTVTLTSSTVTPQPKVDIPVNYVDDPNP